jgi:uncharacterized alkaline shock family protein YloU
MPKITTGLARHARISSPLQSPASEDHDAYHWNGAFVVSSRAIATVAGRAVAQCYGVVGIAAAHPRLAAVELLDPTHYSRGVVVRFEHSHITIDLYVVLEHGLRITEIAHNIMANVRFAVAQALGTAVVRVNVNVQALRVSGGEHLGR